LFSSSFSIRFASNAALSWSNSSGGGFKQAQPESIAAQMPDEASFKMEFFILGRLLINSIHLLQRKILEKDRADFPT